MILELLLASHSRDCTTCRRMEVCTLQKLSVQLGVNYVQFENNKPRSRWIESSRLYRRDPNQMYSVRRLCENL
ncbi:MAG: hypothetical protein ACLR1N_02155 [Bifidobacterium pseudocatenulatum]